METDFYEIQTILSTLANILAKGLTVEQRSKVLRFSQSDLSENLPKNEFGFYELLKDKYTENNNDLSFIEDILHRIQATQIFYQDVGAELDNLKYLLKKNKVLVEKSKKKQPYVFVLMPFQTEFFATYESAIKPTLEKLGCLVAQAEEIHTPDHIIDVIYSQIAKADFIIADATKKNPNVFYEIGYAHALGKKVIILVQDPGDIPFDIRAIRYIQYTPKSRNLLAENLQKMAESVMANDNNQ